MTEECTAKEAKKLKLELKKCGLKTIGKKEELLACLVAGMESNLPVGNVEDVQKHDASLNSLLPTAHWEVLTPKPNQFPELSKADPSLVPPTELDASSLNPKHGFSSIFDCPEFCGQREDTV